MINLQSGYIGNIDTWRNILTILLKSHLSSLEQYFDEYQIDLLVRYWEKVNKHTKYPVSSSYQLPQSYIDLLESGVLIFFDRLFSLFQENIENIDFQTTNGFLIFQDPEKLCVLEQYITKKSPSIKYGNEVFEELFTYSQPLKTAIYLDYSFMDEFSLPAQDLQSLNSSLIIADGEITMNGSLVYMNQQVSFIDGEKEVGIYSFSESSCIRYKSFAELIAINCFSMFIDTEIMTVPQLINEVKDFSYIFDESSQYTYDGYFR